MYFYELLAFSIINNNDIINGTAKKSSSPHAMKTPRRSADQKTKYKFSLNKIRNYLDLHYENIGK